VTAHVQAGRHGCVRELRVHVRNECLVLTGWTYTFYAKQRAQQYVREMSELPVANEISMADGALPYSEAGSG
jgi:hypothetical protein